MILVRRSRTFRLLAAATASAALLVACTDADADNAARPRGTEEQATSAAADRGYEVDGPDDGASSTPSNSSR
jgi:hypothetical protein